MDIMYEGLLWILHDKIVMDGSFYQEERVSSQRATSWNIHIMFIVRSSYKSELAFQGI